MLVIPPHLPVHFLENNVFLKCPKPILLFFLVLTNSFLIAQTATITGIVFDTNKNPLTNVNIVSGSHGTTTDENGHYRLIVDADTQISISFSHIGFKEVTLLDFILTTNETFEFHPILSTKTEQVSEVSITATGNKISKIISISPGTVRKMPSANAGVESILKLLPSVSSNNELSTQYAVRGGNYDENLVYVNDIEVYRPFLIRSGQQEGLGFSNSDLIQKLEFSSGGFQSKYGDKLSSVLDITYKVPIDFAVNLNLSLLGTSASVESVSKNEKFSALLGLRHRDNRVLVNSKQTKSNFDPVFYDVQTYLTYRFSKKFHLNFLGTFSSNNYKNQPLSRQTNFGTLNEPRSLTVFYQGRENNRFNTALGAMKADYFLNDNVVLKLISSIYHTTEEERSDIIAQYRIGSVNTDLSDDNLGKPTVPEDFGAQIKRARNDLDALIHNFKHKGTYAKDGNVLEWGVEFKREDIRDQIRESEFLDSAGYFIRPPLTGDGNNEPYEPFNDPLVAYNNIQSRNNVITNRISGFVQFGKKTEWKNHHVYYNLGLRAQQWTVSSSNEKKSMAILSPRLQFALKPDWEKDMTFHISGGIYQQPPFYRELRNKDGLVNVNVKAQKSVQFVLGNDYSFSLWKRPFILKNEVFYKNLTNVNPYTLEDVRIRYAAENNTKAYAYGIETRLSGAFVPGTESWISLGFLKTKENIHNQGFISRPTDQRFNLGLLFQDYVPNYPNIKMYLNLVYNTGLPGGSPNYADPYEYQNRLRDYKRADLGISYIFAERNNPYPKGHWLASFEELNVGIEIFNLFNNQNSITNTWVRDVESKQQFAVPNFMTSRVLNIKLGMRF